MMFRLARRVALVCAAALVALLPLACSKKTTQPAPLAQLGPLVQQVSPLARALRSTYDTDIWAQFDRALDGRSVDSTTVFLKIDTRRIPVDVNYEGITRRVRVLPRALLDLNRTYTVELSPRIRAKDGTTLAATYFWQFTTNSLRRIRYDYPAIEAVEGPFSATGWSGNGSATNNIQYDVFAGLDSSAVLDRSILPLSHSPFPTFTPRMRWPLGGRVYWAVDATNLTTTETLRGGLSHYVILPEGTPVDSFDVNLFDFGGVQLGRANTQYCNSAQMITGSNFNMGIRWAISGTGPMLRVADVSAVMWLQSTYSGQVDAAQPMLWSAQNTWSSCSFVFPGPPFTNTNGGLAMAHGVADPLKVVFRSDTLSAFVEQMARRNTGVGFLMRSTNQLGYQSPLSGPPTRFTVRYYVLPTARPSLARPR